MVSRLPLLLASLGLAAPLAARADTFVVDDAGDAALCDPATTCTLRGAILAANARNGADTIVFEGAGAPVVITPTSPLPFITDELTLDGFDCTGCGATPDDNGNDIADGLDSVLTVTVDGSLLPAPAPGATEGLLTSDAADTTVIGLNLRSGPAHGLVLLGSGARVVGCFIGTDRDGTAAAPNALDGVHCAGCEVTIEDGNLVSGNGRYGIYQEGAVSDGGDIRGNLVGVDRSGAVPLGNGSHGIYVVNTDGADEVTDLEIGDYADDQANIVGGNGGDGVRVEGFWVDLQIQGSWIGVSPGGSDIGNAGYGVYVSGDSGVTAFPSSELLIDANLVGWNGEGGVVVESASTGWIVDNGVGGDLAGA